MVKAVIFDFFGVVCSDEFWKFVKEDKNLPGQFSDLARSVNIGELSWPDFLKKIADETSRSPENVQRLYKQERINLPLVAYIEKLHHDYKTALLTNASQEFVAPILKDANLNGLFDEVIVSSPLGIAKPDPRIFELTLERLGVNPEEAVFIDDIERYVTAARKLGIRGIVYKDFEQTEKELRALLVPGPDD